MEDNINDIHMSETIFFGFENQGNVYTSAVVPKWNDVSKIFVSTRREKAYCIDYSDGRFFMEEIYFKSISSSLDMLSMDVAKRNVSDDNFIIGITCAKKNRNSNFDTLMCLYIFDGRNCLQDKISDDSFKVDLNFIPYHLVHTQLCCEETLETVFLLSGGDKSIHLYRFSSKVLANHFQECSADNLFPEFGEVCGITLYMDFMNSADYKKRCSAFSVEGGNVYLFNIEKVNSKMCIQAKRIIEFDFPSSSVKLFETCRSIECPEFMKKDEVKEDEFDVEFFERINVVVANTLESCFVYSASILNSEEHLLPQSDCYDVVTCCHVCDIDFDGKNEILIGTYAQKVLIYKETGCGSSGWSLFNSLHFPSPVHALFSEDIVGDGVKQLIIVTMTGIHIYEHSPEVVSLLIKQRIMSLSDGQ